MNKKIQEAINSAKNFASVACPASGPKSSEQAGQLATAWALIAIAEALLEERQQAEFAAEVEEMRQERQGRNYGYGGLDS